MLSGNRGPNDVSGREPLAGLIERVTFHNPDNGFCLLRVKVKGHHELVTLLGAAPSVAAGEYIRAVDPDAQEVVIDFDGRPVTYDFGELDEVSPAYATTIHKAQGSEYPAVVIPLTTQHYLMLRRNLVYTGITRARQLVVLVGQRHALSIAVKDSRAQTRWSKLERWLRYS